MVTLIGCVSRKAPGARPARDLYDSELFRRRRASAERSGRPWLILEKIRRPIQEIWAEDVRRHGAEGPSHLANTAAALDPALWFFGKWGCTRCEQAGRRLPISEICGECQFDLLVGVKTPP